MLEYAVDINAVNTGQQRGRGYRKVGKRRSSPDSGLPEQGPPLLEEQVAEGLFITCTDTLKVD